MSIPRIASEYVNVYRPGGDVFPGPDAAELNAGQFYQDWVPNDHCFARDGSGRWHVFGITHPMTDLENVHAGECLLFHAIAPPGTLGDTLKEGSWQELQKVLPPSERPGDPRAVDSPAQRSFPHGLRSDSHSLRRVERPEPLDSQGKLAGSPTVTDKTPEVIKRSEWKSPTGEPDQRKRTSRSAKIV